MLRQRCLREAQRVLHHREDAEEAVQEALARAWRRRHSCRTPEAPMAWILRITHHEALRQLARRQRIRERERDDLADKMPATDGHKTDEVLSAIVAQQALQSLAPEERRLVQLRYFDDLTQPQVAQRLDLPEGTVKVRLHRVRARLKSAFADAP